MCKKILRILSVALVLALVVGMCPIGTNALGEADKKAAQIKQQIRDVYRACQRGSGFYSFYGYCGTMVSWQLYVMGITTDVIAVDGNMQFDRFKNLDYSSGGYRVRAYPAATYSLEQTLNIITENGTKDAYNILVGFEQTNSAAGRRYGHAVVIHAIVDGIVYFCESYANTVEGQFFPEGAPVYCSMAEFVRIYTRWNKLDGVIHFGLKDYDDGCELYPSYLYASVTEQTDLYSQPCLPQVDDSSVKQRSVQVGERISVTGLYRNTEGEYWYQVQDAQVGYIRAEHTKVLQMRYDDVTVEGVDAPTRLFQGYGFNIKGQIRSVYNEICTVRAQVFTYADEGQKHVMSATHSLEDNSYSLSYTAMSNQMAFRKLLAGSYRYELAVVVGNTYFADGKQQTEWKTVMLWQSDFLVVTTWDGGCNVSFDPAGGTTELDRAQVSQGDVLERLPQASRDGYVFEGWYTSDGQKVEDYPVITGDVTYYAHWSMDPEAEGWYVENGQWSYLRNGTKATGFVETDGIFYHINASGELDTGWEKIDGRQYYFYANGAMHVGWFDAHAGRFYFTEQGAMIGWMELEGKTYYFDKAGTMTTGNVVIDGVGYYFDDDGVLQTKEGEL